MRLLHRVLRWDHPKEIRSADRFPPAVLPQPASTPALRGTLHPEICFALREADQEPLQIPALSLRPASSSGVSCGSLWAQMVVSTVPRGPPPSARRPLTPRIKAPPTSSSSNTQAPPIPFSP